jgi:hypothetical protein
MEKIDNIANLEDILIEFKLELRETVHAFIWDMRESYEKFEVLGLFCFFGFLGL